MLTTKKRPIPFTCIYCQRSRPEVMPSEAHIFPDVIGGVTSTTNTVCKACNNTVNREVERPALPVFTFFRNIWGLQSRRNRVPRLPARLVIDGRQEDVTLGEHGQPTRAIVDTESDAMGRTTYVVTGPSEAAEAKRQEIAQKYPTLQWSKHPVETVEWFVRHEVDPTAMPLRRLATKVAFEWFAQLRSSAILAAPEFDAARAFILTGIEQDACCGVLAVQKLLYGPLNFPLPHHAVIIIAHPSDRILGAFVAFYSLFYYWVILSRQYQALAPWDDCLLEHPQSGSVQQPLLRWGVGSVRVPWHDLEQAYHSDPLAVKGAASTYATRKFKTAAEEFYQRRASHGHD